MDGGLLHGGCWVTARWMVSYCTTDGELQHSGWGVTAHGWVKKIPELLPEDVGTFLVKIKVEGNISRQKSTFLWIFIFQ